MPKSQKRTTTDRPGCPRQPGTEPRIWETEQMGGTELTRTFTRVHYGERHTATMSAPKGFRPFHRAATATRLGVTINANTGHLMFNTLAKRELLDLLHTDNTEELTFFFDNTTNRIYMRPARTNEGERGWKLNPNNGMVSAAMVRNWMLDHGYEPSVQYSLIAHEQGWMIEPGITTVQHRTRRGTDDVNHIHLDRTRELAVA